jgi:hypothetical protein
MTYLKNDNMNNKKKYESCLIIKCFDIDVVNDVCDYLDECGLEISAGDGNKIIISEKVITKCGYDIRGVKELLHENEDLDGLYTTFTSDVNFSDMTYSI